jgi:membrane dipeptidase
MKQDMKFIDLHCDTLMAVYLKKQEDLFHTGAMLDIRRMKESGALAQVFAIFMPGPGAGIYGVPEDFEDEGYIEFCFALFGRAMERYGFCIAPALSGGDIVENETRGKMSALLSFEDGRPIGGSLENLDHYYRRGIRLITLTWNGENCFGYPNSPDRAAMSRGLKPFGRDAVRRMNELGILIDVSHLSDGGFSDVAALSAKPFTASHSNCRSLSPHPRNLTDEQIRLLASGGGVIGLNFAPPFLGRDPSASDSTAALISAHAGHLKKTGGIGCIALGSDFDGIQGNLEISGVAEMPRLFDQLSKDGFTTGEIEQIAWKNALRLFRDVLD